MVNGTEEGLSRVKDKYENSSLIDTFDYSKQIAQGFKEYLSQTTAVIGLLVVVGVLIGFSVIYVSITITISERYRELATMLVVGLMEREVHQVLLIEQAILSVVGIAIGLPMGKAMMMAFAKTSSTDQLIMPAQVPMSAVLFSTVFTIVAIILPQYFARKEIERIVVTEALNARE
jgi:putative ABC transport system permease protein